jgi:phage gp46-like protein
MPTLFPTRNAPAILTIPASGSDPSTSQLTIAWGVAPLFDYSANKFLLNNNNDLAVGTEAQTLSQWITNAIITPRLGYYIHRRTFGSDFDLLIAENYPASVVKKLSEKYTEEALQSDNRIANVKKVEARPYRNYVVIDCTIVTRSGFEQQFQVKWSI